MDRPLLLRRLAVVFATICFLLMGWYYVAMPTTLRVAVGPDDSPQVRFLQAVARALKDAQQPFRFQIVSVRDSAAASRALDTRQVELAVLRSDDGSSLEAQSIAMLDKRVILIVARADSGIDTIADLRGRSLALVAPPGDSNRGIIEQILQHYELQPAFVSIDEVAVPDFKASTKRHDAYVVIADPGSGAPRPVIDAIAGQERAPLKFIGLPAPDGLALRLREVQKSTIPIGAFGGVPPTPPEAIETVAISYELVGTARLAQAPVTQLLEALIEVRTRIRRYVPRSSFDVEAPPVEGLRRFLPHKGAAAYVNDEDATTFLDTYSEQIWLLLFSLSIVGSSITGYLGWTGFFDQTPTSQKLPRRISALARRLGGVQTVEDLEEIQRELDRVVVAYLERIHRNGNDGETELPVAIWISSLAGVIERRRADLASRFKES